MAREDCGDMVDPVFESWGNHQTMARSKVIRNTSIWFNCQIPLLCERPLGPNGKRTGNKRDVTRQPSAHVWLLACWACDCEGKVIPVVWVIRIVRINNFITLSPEFTIQFIFLTLFKNSVAQCYHPAGWVISVWCVCDGQKSFGSITVLLYYFKSLIYIVPYYLIFRTLCLICAFLQVDHTIKIFVAVRVSVSCLKKKRSFGAPKLSERRAKFKMVEICFRFFLCLAGWPRWTDVWRT